jgi:hypothetical protein
MESTTAEGHVISGLPNHVDKVMQVHLRNMEYFKKILLGAINLQEAKI